MIHRMPQKMTLPRFGRVPKAEVYSLKIRKGIINDHGSRSLHPGIQRGSRAASPDEWQVHNVVVVNISVTWQYAMRQASQRYAVLAERLRFARAVRSRPFALLWTGQTISVIGDAVFNIAIAWEQLLKRDE
jgi:hypothetical protein